MAQRAHREDPLAGVRLTHPDRVLFPAQGITKRELALYIHAVARWMLPHVLGRPLTLVRCPEGTVKPCFFMKHSGVWAPRALHRVQLQEARKVGTYLVATDEAGLLGLVQMGVLEVHTWNSTIEMGPRNGFPRPPATASGGQGPPPSNAIDSVEQPDRVVFDLDPGDDVPWSRVVEAARLVRTRLAGIGLESFVKTTGGKGLHVVVPLRRGPGWDECLTFTRVVARQLAREQPARYTAELSRARRHGRILLDYLRNNRGSTSVAAYSPRARPGAPVSVPISWEELDSGVRSQAFDVRSVPARLARRRRDPWERYWSVDQRLFAGG